MSKIYLRVVADSKGKLRLRVHPVMVKEGFNPHWNIQGSREIREKASEEDLLSLDGALVDRGGYYRAAGAVQICKKSEVEYVLSLGHRGTPPPEKKVRNYGDDTNPFNM